MFPDPGPHEETVSKKTIFVYVKYVVPTNLTGENCTKWIRVPHGIPGHTLGLIPPPPPQALLVTPNGSEFRISLWLSLLAPERSYCNLTYPKMLPHHSFGPCINDQNSLDLAILPHQNIIHTHSRDGFVSDTTSKGSFVQGTQYPRNFGRDTLVRDKLTLHREVFGISVLLFFLPRILSFESKILLS